MLSALAVERLQHTNSSSFGVDLKKWHNVMQSYETGGFAYHVTMPTDSIAHFAKIMKETEEYGFDKVINTEIFCFFLLFCFFAFLLFASCPIFFDSPLFFPQNSSLFLSFPLSLTFPMFIL
jgi:hypothetical protein